MRKDLHWNYKDVFRALRFGFSAKKMWVMFLGILAGTAIYSIFSYVGLILSGYGIKEIWDTSKFVPLPWNYYLSGWGLFFISLGLFIFFIIYFLFGVAVSKITIQQLKGDEFYEVKKALSYAFKNGRASLYTPILLAVTVLLILLGGVVLGLIGKIPVLGLIILIILIIPVVLTVYFLLYLILSLILSLYLAPVVVGTTKSDTFDTLFEVFSTLNEQNWRFLGYQILLYLTKIIGFTLFVFFTGRVLGIIHGVMTLPFLMGKKFEVLSEAALYYLPYINLPNPTFSHIFDSFVRFTKIEPLLFPPTSLPELGLLEHITGFLFGLTLYVLIFFSVAFWASIHFAGNTIIFTVILRKKDDINLLEEKQEEVVVAPTHPTELEEKMEEKKD